MNKKRANKIYEPLVTIIIPFFNSGRYIGEAIDSVLGQTYGETEIILVDDGSKDESAEIAKRYQSRFSKKIKVLGHKDGVNLGASASRNIGVKEARGELITFLDSDDILLPDAIEKEVNAFRMNPDADVVCGTLECWYSWSKDSAALEKDFEVDLLLEVEKLYLPPYLFIHNMVSGGRKPGVNCVMMSADFARQNRVFESEFQYAWEDQVFWAKVSLNGSIFVMDECLSRYRQHPSSTSSTELATGVDTIGIPIFLEWLGRYLDEQEIKNEDVWSAYKSFKRSCEIQIRLNSLKRIYRSLLPLYLRYKIRDIWTRMVDPTKMYTPRVNDSFDPSREHQQETDSISSVSSLKKSLRNDY